MNQHGLGFGNDLLAGGNIHLTLDNLAPHINPDALEIGIQAPVATGIAINGRVVLVLKVLRPDELRTIPHGTTVDAGLLHHGTDTGTARIFLAVVLAQHLGQHVVIATVVIAHAVVLGQASDEGTEAHALVVIETAAMGVLIEKEHGLWIFLTSL